jgi:hypothetical protein
VAIEAEDLSDVNYVSFFRYSSIFIFSIYSGRSALSPDGEFLVATNLYDGVDWYSIKSRMLVHSMVQRIETNVTIPVTFIDHGSAILVGGSCGHASICDANTGETIQELEHDGEFCNVTKTLLLNV